MSVPATEIAILPVGVETTIEDPSSSSGKTWKWAIDTVLAQKGAQHVYWGRQLENPNIVDFFVDWDSVEFHKQFISSSTYKPFEEVFLSHLNGPFAIYHAYFHPHSPISALKSTPTSVTEYLTFYFDVDMSDHDKFTWEKIFSTFKSVLERSAEGYRGGAGGWLEEKVQYDSIGGDAAAYVGVFDWENVEKHTGFRDTMEFKESIGPLRAASKGRQVHHVTFQRG